MSIFVFRPPRRMRDLLYSSSQLNYPPTSMTNGVVKKVAGRSPNPASGPGGQAFLTIQLIAEVAEEFCFDL